MVTVLFTEIKITAVVQFIIYIKGGRLHRTYILSFNTLQNTINIHSINTHKLTIFYTRFFFVSLHSENTKFSLYNEQNYHTASQHF